MVRKLPAKVVYLIMSGIAALSFTIYGTVSMVYMVKTVGLNPLQLVLVGTVLELTAFALEVPTGIVADLYSRRLSIIIGMVLVGLGFIATGAFALFGTLLLAQIIWGAGATFGSGATEAWIVDEVGEANAGPVFLRATQIMLVCELIGIGISVVLASINIALPIVVGGVLHIVLAGFLILVMPEAHFTPTPRDNRTTWQSMVHTFKDGVKVVRGRPVLMAIIASSFIYGAYSEGFDRLWTAHLLQYFTLPRLDGFDPIVWFGVISAVAVVLGIGAIELARRRLNTTNQKTIAQALATFYTLIVLGLMVFALATSFGMALVAYWLMVIFRTTAGPIFSAWMNLNIESRVRATVISMSAQSNAIGQIGGGPLIGLVATVFSLRAALFGSALMLIPAVWLFGRTTRLEVADAALPEAEAIT